MRKGKFIVIDGIGGCGKSTHAKLLHARIGKGAVLTHEPGGAPIAEHLRKVLLQDLIPETDVLTDFFLFWTARAEHMRKTIVPALQAGRDVITDRFDSSTFAFQVMGEQHPELDKLFWETRKAVVGKYEPDVYIILDIPVLAAEKRRALRASKEDRFDDESRAYQARVRAGFKKFAKEMGKKAYVVNSNRTKEEVDENVWNILNKALS